jgi:hypothetical protein
MAERDGIGAGRRGFIRDTWHGGGIRGGLRGGRGGMIFGPGSFSLSLPLARKRNGLCVTFCGCAVGFEEEETIGTSINGDALSRVKMCFTPSALFQALGPVVTSKLLGVCDIQQ